MEHLIIRNKNFTKNQYINRDSRENIFTESRVGGVPIGYKNSSVEDKVWLYEAGYAVLMKGIITEKFDLWELNNLEDIMRFYHAFNIDEPYLVALLDKKYNSPKTLFVWRVKVDLKPLKNPFPVKQSISTVRNSWIYLKNDKLCEFNKLKEYNVLDYFLYKEQDIDKLKEIPASLKYKLFELFRLSGIHSIDIDHIIPKSVGGLGHFIENCQPLNLSINRKKSDKIPNALFDVAKNDIRLKKYLKGEDSYNKLIVKKNTATTRKEIAKKIMIETHSWDKAEQRRFYGMVLKRYSVDYFEIIKKHTGYEYEL